MTSELQYLLAELTKVYGVRNTSSYNKSVYNLLRELVKQVEANDGNT